MLGYESCRQFRVALSLIAMLATSVATAGDQDFAAVNAWGKLQMFKTCEKGALLHRTFDPQLQEWSEWKSIAKHEITSAPSALLKDESRLHVFFRGKDHRLYVVYQDRDGDWSSVISLGDRKMYSAPTTVVIDGTLTVFARRADSGLMKIFYDKNLGSWTKWIDVDPPVISSLAGKWTVKYSHGSVRTYVIEANGKVTANVEQAILIGQVTAKDGHFFLEFEGDGKLERLTLQQDSRVFVEHYNPKGGFPNERPNVTGYGKLQDKIAQAAEESYSGITSAELQRAVDNVMKRKWRPRTVRGYEVNGEVKYDVTFTSAPGGDWKMKHDISDETFKSTNDTLLKNGYKLSVHSLWKNFGATYHVAIWTKE